MMVPKKEARPGRGRALEPDHTERSATKHNHNNLSIEVNQEKVRNYILIRQIKSCISWLFCWNFISFSAACRLAHFCGVRHA
jgi:hypothetical protein